VAVREGVGYATARRWYAGGLLPAPARRAGGPVLVGDAAPAPSGVTAVYARVSSGGQKPDLDRQVARATVWAASRGLSVGRVVTEVGSALNGRRGKFLGLLRNRRVETIVVEHRGRFARFGAGYVEAALHALGRRLLAVDTAGVDNDLVRDVTAILASLCARLHGGRAAADRAAGAMAVITGDAP
jgi:predicted site-specific integrase-resolvase